MQTRNPHPMSAVRALSLVDQIFNNAIPIFLTSAVSAAAVLINIAVVVGFDKSYLYYLGLFLPMYYAALAIQEGLRVPVLRHAAATREDGRAAQLGLYLGLVIVLLVIGILALVGLFWLGRSFLADLYQIPEADQPTVNGFVSGLLLASMVPGVASMVLSALFGVGKSTIAGSFGIIATGINVLTAYICAAYFGQGIYSLVWAAVTGGGCLLLAALIVLWTQRRVLPTLRRPSAQIKTVLSDVLALSLPVSFSFIAIFGFLFVFNHLVSYYGPAEVAGFGIAFRIQSFVILPAIALATALAILINGAIASGRFPLIRQYFRVGMTVAFVLYAAIAAAIYLFQEPLLRRFTSEAAEVAAGMRYLSVVAPSYLSFGPVLVLLTLLEQTGYGVRTMLVNIVFFALELGFASILGLERPTASTLYLVIAAVNWLAAGYLVFEVAQRMGPPKGKAPTVDAVAEPGQS